MCGCVPAIEVELDAALHQFLHPQMCLRQIGCDLVDRATEGGTKIAAAIGEHIEKALGLGDARRRTNQRGQ